MKNASSPIDTPNAAVHHWHVVYTKPRWEKKIATLLTNKGIENYCPVQNVLRQWSDRKKIVVEPIFKSYVFVSVPVAQRWQVLDTDGVLNFVHYLGKPAVIRAVEMEAIRHFLGENKNATITPITLMPGQKVTISEGALTGQKAEVLSVSNNKVQVVIQSLGILLRATISKEAIILEV